MGLSLADVFPGWAAKRAARRLQYLELQRLYNAASSTSFRPTRGGPESGNTAVEHARGTLRNWGRYLEENSDLAAGVYDDLVDRTIGRGIEVEPMPRDSRGEVMSDLAGRMRRAWHDWTRKAEHTQTVPWGELQRLFWRSTVRDGEHVVRFLRGVAGYRYPTAVPLALQALEADYLPFDLTGGFGDIPENILHGVEHDDFGVPRAYHLYKRHPGDFRHSLHGLGILEETVPVPVSEILHPRCIKRIGQVRGVTIMASVIQRLQDLTDYEESERLAAKVAASFTAVITKNPDTPGTILTPGTGDRSFKMESAMIFDGLLPGERVETLDSNRPSNALSDFRSAMLRAVSAGTGARYSTIARTWESSYTAMRQESVVMMPGTDRMQDYYVQSTLRPIYEAWVDMAVLVGVIEPRGADLGTLYDADYRGPGVPWLSPLDEARAADQSLKNRLKSRKQLMRERGDDPARVDAEIETDILFEDAVSEPAQQEDQPA